VDRAVSLAAPLLRNSIDVASRRFNLKMGITAGIDSRVVLAASRSAADRICYYTRGHEKDNSCFQDAIVPSRLLPSLGIKHRVLPWEPMDDEFRHMYESSVTFARESKGNIAFTLQRNLGSDFTVMSGNLSEISQCRYWLPRSRIDGQGLAIATGLCHPFAVREFEKWLAGARAACSAAGMNVLALFHWEQRGGRWAATSFAEYDIVHESFAPFNNRLLNEILLGVPERYRRDRMQTVALRLVKGMWPEVLSEPINPPTTVGERTQEFIRRAVLHTLVTPWCPAYEYAKYLRKRMRVRTRQMGRGTPS
jgi:hypothetical protein